MGAAASSVDLTPEQRALITSDVENKYKIMTTEESKTHEAAVEELTKLLGSQKPTISLSANVEGPPTDSPKTPGKGKPVPSIHSGAVKQNSLKGGDLMESLRADVDQDFADVNLKTVDKKANASLEMDDLPDFQPRIARAATIDTAGMKNSVSGMLEDQEKVAKFL